MPNLESIASKLDLKATELSQRDICKIQIDRAIKCFLEERDFVSTITLALAAEGIVGERLGDDSMVASLLPLLREKYVPDLSEKQISDDHLNRARNFFKHAKGDFEQREVFELEFEAITAIIRAYVNYALITDGHIFDSAERFFSWLKENKKDLLGAADAL